MRTDLLSMLRTRRRERTTDVLTLAREVASGKAPPADDIIEALAAVGMDDESFDHLVGMIERRSELRTVAAGITEAERELKSLDDEITRHEQALDAAKSRFVAAVEPLEAQRVAARSRAAEARSAEAALTSPANLPAMLVERREDARKAMHAASAELQRLREQFTRQQQRVDDGLRLLDAEGGFDRMESAWADEANRHKLPHGVCKAVEDVRGGRHQIASLTPEITSAAAAERKAAAAFAAVERECVEF